MVFDGQGPLVKRWNGFNGSNRSTVEGEEEIEDKGDEDVEEKMEEKISRMSWCCTS